MHSPHLILWICRWQNLQTCWHQLLVTGIFFHPTIPIEGVPFLPDCQIYFVYFLPLFALQILQLTSLFPTSTLSLGLGHQEYLNYFTKTISLFWFILSQGWLFWLFGSPCPCPAFEGPWVIGLKVWPEACLIWWTIETLWKVSLKHPGTRDRSQCADLQSFSCKINWNLNFSTVFTFDVQTFHTFCKYLSTPSEQIVIFGDVGHLVILSGLPVVFLSNIFSNHWAINLISKLMIHSWLS